LGLQFRASELELGSLALPFAPSFSLGRDFFWTLRRSVLVRMADDWLVLCHNL